MTTFDASPGPLAAFSSFASDFFVITTWAETVFCSALAVYHDASAAAQIQPTILSHAAFR